MTTARTQAFAIGFCLLLLCIPSPCGLSQNSHQERTLETVKDLAAEIDRYIKDHGEADRKFIARIHPGDDRLRKNVWEWKELESWDEAEAFFKDYYGYRDAGVHVRNASVVYVATEAWSDSGDWYFYVKYYYDDEGRLLQIAADFRSVTDRKRVLDFQYFDDTGSVLDHIIEYYEGMTDKRLSEKPDMTIEIHDIPVYLKVSDLPFYSLLKVGLPKKNK